MSLITMEFTTYFGLGDCVVCNGCGWKGLVPLNEETCPNCKSKEYLTWQDFYNPEKYGMITVPKEPQSSV